MCTTRMHTAHRAKVVADREFLAAVAEHEPVCDWKNDGAADYPAWLAARYQEPYAVARQWVEDAHALEELPALDEAYAHGQLSTGQMHALGVVADLDTIDDWLARCRDESWDIRRLRRQARKTKARRLEKIDGGMYLSMHLTRDEGWYDIRGRLTVEGGAALITTVDGAVPPGTPWTSINHWRAQGLMELVRRRSGGGCARPAISVHINADDPDPVGRIQGLGFLPKHAVARLAQEATIRLVIDGLDSQKSFAAVPDSVADVVADRDQTCTFHGCERTAFLQKHHIRYRRNSGPHIVTNLMLACAYHHSLIHKHGWTLEGLAGPNITWVRPDGRKLRRGTARYDTS